MAGNNSQGCGGGILHIFAAIGMMFMTCARFADDFARCGRSASHMDNFASARHLDDWGSGVRAVDGLAESRNYDHLLKAAEDMKNTRRATQADYDYRPINALDAVREAARVPQDLNRNQAGDNSSKVVIDSTATKQELNSGNHRVHLMDYLKAYRINNPFFSDKQKLSIRALGYRTSYYNFSAFADAIKEIDENCIRIQEIFPGNKRVLKTYKEWVIENFNALSRKTVITSAMLKELPKVKYPDLLQTAVKGLDLTEAQEHLLKEL